jgi:integrase
MPRQSDTGNVKKLCACGRAKWSACAHPWYVDYKAPKDHPRRPNERYRKNLDVAAAKHAANLREAQDEARRAITAWLDGRNPADLQPADRPTLAQLLDVYVKRPDAAINDGLQVKRIVKAVVLDRPFGDWRAAEITREAVDAFRAQRPRVAGNRNLALLRALFNWAVVGGLVPSTPFRVGHVPVIRLGREQARTRRLQAGEEEQLMLAGNGLRDLIVAALESGCRRGELLGLQWCDVRAELVLPAAKTKARKDRRVPISSALQAVLDARRNDPAGTPLPADAYVFGDEIGRRRGPFKTAWRLTCDRAQITDLHFHDLRREAGSRWMDAGVPLATIQRWLGHANISQTSKYLAASLGGDESAIMRAFETRIGRLPQIDISSGSTGIDATRSDQTMTEKPQSNAMVH